MLKYLLYYLITIPCWIVIFMFINNKKNRIITMFLILILIFASKYIL